MKLLLYLTFCFIIFELLKLTMLKAYWNASLKRNKHPFLAFLELMYFIYLIALMFVGYWYVGTIVIVVSIITAFQLMDDVMEFSKFDKKIKNSLFVDGFVSILLLLIIIVKELKK